MTDGVTSAMAKLSCGSSGLSGNIFIEFYDSTTQDCNHLNQSITMKVYSGFFANMAPTRQECKCGVDPTCGPDTGGGM